MDSASEDVEGMTLDVSRERESLQRQKMTVTHEDDCLDEKSVMDRNRHAVRD